MGLEAVLDRPVRPVFPAITQSLPLMSTRSPRRSCPLPSITLPTSVPPVVPSLTSTDSAPVSLIVFSGDEVAVAGSGSPPLYSPQLLFAEPT